MSTAPRATTGILLLLFLVGCGNGGSDSSTEADPDPAALQNTLRWTTASEVDNYGFDVYRALEEAGPFVVINESPIPAAGTTDVPQDYEYVDLEVEPDTAYFYYVESISMSGVRERATPTIRSVPAAASAELEPETNGP